MTASIAELADAVRAQLAKDERVARELSAWADGTGRADGGSHEFGRLLGDPVIGPFGGQSPVRNWGTGREIAHFADPATTLARVGRLRRLVDLITAEQHALCDDPGYNCAALGWSGKGGTGDPCSCGRDERVRAYLALLLPETTEET